MAGLHSALLRSGAYCRSLCKARFSTSSHLNNPKQTIEEKLGLDRKPKKPITPYLRFAAQVRPEIKQAQPDIKPTVIMKVIAERWKTVDERLKDELKKAFERDVIKYQEEVKEYDLKIGPDARDKILLAKANEKLRKEKILLKKRREQLGCPKKPPTSYLLFLKAKASERGEVPYQEWQTKLSSEWNALNDVQKAPYVELAKKELEEYSMRMSQWEREMASQGLTTVLNMKHEKKHNIHKPLMNRKSEKLN